MTINEPLGSAANEVALAEAELRSAREKLEAAKAKLAATSGAACVFEDGVVAAAAADGAPGEAEAAFGEGSPSATCDEQPAGEQVAPDKVEADAACAKPVEPEAEPDWVPYSTAAIPAAQAPAAEPAVAAPAPVAPQPPMPTGAPVATGAPMPTGAPVAPGGAQACGQAAAGYYAAPGYAPPQTPPHAGPGAVPPQQPYYGYQQPYYQQPYGQPMLTTKDHVAAGLLAIFLGAFGIHKFYLGYNTAGFIMLAVSVIGGVVTFTLAFWVMWVIAIIEGILYFTKSQTEFEQLYVQNKREWF